jgi:hypothetical protein
MAHRPAKAVFEGSNPFSDTHLRCYGSTPACHVGGAGPIPARCSERDLNVVAYRKGNTLTKLWRALLAIIVSVAFFVPTAPPVSANGDITEFYLSTTIVEACKYFTTYMWYKEKVTGGPSQTHWVQVRVRAINSDGIVFYQYTWDPFLMHNNDTLGTFVGLPGIQPLSDDVDFGGHNGHVEWTILSPNGSTIQNLEDRTLAIVEPTSAPWSC